MRNATCAASKTSKVPTQDALLFISDSMTQASVSPGYIQTLENNGQKHRAARSCFHHCFLVFGYPGETLAVDILLTIIT